ncbi:MAG: dTDP-4-dehydrorhamnose reductase [Ignavibacteriales bacterium]|nr:dTDP-4-dehydrorhamnose reductase [Ignavibacteriales bacterium]
MRPDDLIKRRILLFGANGMLGRRTAARFLANDRVETLGAGIEEEPATEGLEYIRADVADRASVKRTVYDFSPHAIVNCAAFTAVDRCETEREAAWKANVKGVEYLAEAARVIDARVVHVSTDYVFDGRRGYYVETDKPNPISYYGRTKLASENALRVSGAEHVVLRTNVLYGPAGGTSFDFVQWVVESVRAGKPIRIVTDQINNPTYADDLAEAIARCANNRARGVYHIGGREFLSRYDFTMRIADFFDLDKSLITPITTEELTLPARRPLKSGLVTLKAETELGYRASGVEETFRLMKRALDL